MLTVVPQSSFTVSIDDTGLELALPLPEDDEGSEHEGNDEVEQERQRLLDQLHVGDVGVFCLGSLADASFLLQAGVLHLVANMTVILLLIHWFLHLRQEL